MPENLSVSRPGNCQGPPVLADLSGDSFPEGTLAPGGVPGGGLWEAPGPQVSKSEDPNFVGPQRGFPGSRGGCPRGRGLSTIDSLDTNVAPPADGWGFSRVGL